MKGNTAMKWPKVLMAIVILTFIFICFDYFTLSDNWRFYGWSMFIEEGGEKPAELVFSTRQASSGKGLFPESPYIFTQGWHLFHMGDWEKHLKEFKGKPEIHALEIGSFEGLSAVWQLKNVLAHPTSTITCIDIFDDPVIEERFDRNIEATGIAYKVKKIKGSSEKMLREIGLEQFDYVYIDGCHLAKWVLSDAVMSWDLVKSGGLIIFYYYYFLESRPSWFRPTKIKFLDEYIWKKRVKDNSPKQAIDTFLKIYGSYLEVEFKKWQVVVRKKHEQ